MSKISESARGEMCLVRIPGVCNHNPETVVLAHANGFGMGMKAPDSESAYCCSDCHDVIDGRVHTGWDENDLDLMFFEGQRRTRLILIKKGLLILK
jgi:hypothetical protein